MAIRIPMNPIVIIACTARNQSENYKKMDSIVFIIKRVTFIMNVNYLFIFVNITF